ncbi:MAG: S-layer homology domain-containing protein [Clostridia bacterium]|nr:S-layer homology domain-containing protein [Clostridia bacterium]
MVAKLQRILAFFLALLVSNIITLIPAGVAPAFGDSDLVILSHSDYSVVTSSPVTLSGTVGSSYSSSLTVNGDLTPISQQGAWSKSVSLSPGENTITVRASGTGGSVTRVIRLINTDGAPHITITNPAVETWTVSANSSTVEASVYNADSIEVLLDGSPVSPAPAVTPGALAGYSDVKATINNLHPGTNSITVKATKGSKIATKAVTVIYDDMPALAVDTPANGSVSENPSIQVSGQFSNATQLEFVLNGQSPYVPPNVPGPAYNVALPGLLRPGENTIEVRAKNGGKVTAKTITVTYNPAGPVIFDLNLPVIPAQGTSYTEKVTITGKVRKTTRLEINNLTTGTSLQPQNYSAESENSFSFYELPLKPGVVNRIRLTATGNNATSTAELDIFWEKQPRVVLELPQVYRTIAGNTHIDKFANYTEPLIDVGDNRVQIRGRLENATSSRLWVRGKEQTSLGTGSFDRWVDLAAGNNELALEATSQYGNTTRVTLQIAYKLGPAITIVSPVLPATPGQAVRVNQNKATIIGNVLRAKSGGLTIKVTDPANASTTYTPGFNSQGNFSQEVTLKPGENKVELVATDGFASTTKPFSYLYDDTPAVTVKKPLPEDEIKDNRVTVKGTVWNVDANGLFINGNQVSFDSQGNFSYEVLITDPEKAAISIKAGNGSRVIYQEIPLSSMYKGKPEAIITSHRDGGTVYSNVITVEGRLLGVSNLVYSSGTVKINNLDATLNNEGIFSGRITLKKGANTITVNAKVASKTINKSIKLNYLDLPLEGAVFETTPAANGGTLKVFGDQVVLGIPQGAFAGDSSLTFSVRGSEDVKKDSPEIIYVSKIFRIAGANPVQPVTVSLKYIDGLRDTLLKRLGIFRYDGEKWQSIGGRVDGRKRTVSTEITESGTYAVMAYINSFRDTNGHWAQESIEILLAKGVLEGNGYGYFAPEGALTRAQFAKMLVKALNIPVYNENYGTFRDVDKDSWAYQYVQAAVRAGIVKGTGGGRFKPESPVTRLEAAVMVARAGNLKEAPDQEIQAQLGAYRDKQQIYFSKGAVAAAVKAGLIQGTAANTFSPGSLTTRAQAAKLVTRLMVIQKKL